MILDWLVYIISQFLGCVSALSSLLAYMSCSTKDDFTGKWAMHCFRWPPSEALLIVPRVAPCDERRRYFGFLTPDEFVTRYCSTNGLELRTPEYIYTDHERAVERLRIRTHLNVLSVQVVWLRKLGTSEPLHLDLQFPIRPKRKTIQIVSLCDSDRPFRPRRKHVIRLIEQLKMVGLKYKPEDAMWFDDVWERDSAYYEEEESPWESDDE